MNGNIVIDINQYPGAAMYAKLHNISFKQLVENFLMKFQVPTSQSESQDVETDDFLNSIDDELMKGLAEFAVKEHRAGRCLTQDQVENSVMEAMGWD